MFNFQFIEIYVFGGTCNKMCFILGANYCKI